MNKFSLLLVRLMAMSACLAAAAAVQAGPVDAGLAGWKVEEGVETPSYAVVEPRTTNLNIDTIVLACEAAASSKVLQLQAYLSGEGPMRPKDASPRQLKDDPQAEIFIDGQVFPVALLFADDYAVMADSQEGPYPRLSDALLDAMQAGTTMTLRFDLLAEPAGRPASFDSQAVVDLRAAGARTAIAAVRRCAGPADNDRAGPFLAQH